uniref:Uncharacterized protein n=1 Tax=Rhabditophanes sp. KR3021 TaxID=114890 RepID=A0AC35UEB1_9BILA
MERLPGPNGLPTLTIPDNSPSLFSQSSSSSILPNSDNSALFSQSNIVDSLPSNSGTPSNIDFSTIFGDVSKTVSGLTDIFGKSAANFASDGVDKTAQIVSQVLADNKDTETGRNLFDSIKNATAGNKHLNSIADKLLDMAMPHASSSNPLSGIFGGSSTCFKTCGMEDIQLASRKAAETLVAMKYCLIFMTVATIICMLALTGATLYFCFYKNRQGFGFRDSEALSFNIPGTNKQFMTNNNNYKKRMLTADNPSNNEDEVTKH